ncbi:MAG: SDR family oxidoreductase [Ferruginibacter sp.]|nr:SDR family oxidoreductase [Ferruginibacter sp.]
MILSNLKNKTIIIIGGSSGIGLSVAKMAAENGAAVTITSRSLERAKIASKSIAGEIKAAQLDVNDDNSVKDFFEHQTAVDHIYIAAGSTKIVPLTESSLADSMFSFNERVMGSLRIVKAAITKISNGGSVTFTGGISTDRPIAGAWVSGLGTASAEQLAKVMVMEYPHIRFNAISPGYTDTPMWDAIMGENKLSILTTVAERLPVKKIATPEEVAFAVIFLMANPSITGEVIHIDGGGRLI